MIRCAIVEDDDESAEVLQGYLDRYAQENGCPFAVTRYRDATAFLIEYKSNYEIVLMDIELPFLNGMEASYKLRKMDTEVALIFITNMAQYAIQGYEVNALSFILKPVAYFNFAQKISRAVKYIQFLSDDEIPINKNKSVLRVKASNLKYVEVLGHDLLYHCDSGIYKSYGSLTEVEAVLGKFHFVRCNSCYLVNLKYVREIKNYTVVVGDEELKISRPKRKEFVRALNHYLAEGGH